MDKKMEITHPLTMASKNLLSELYQSTVLVNAGGQDTEIKRLKGLLVLAETDVTLNNTIVFIMAEKTAAKAVESEFTPIKNDLFAVSVINRQSMLIEFHHHINKIMNNGRLGEAFITDLDNAKKSFSNGGNITIGLLNRIVLRAVDVALNRDKRCDADIKRIDALFLCLSASIK